MRTRLTVGNWVRVYTQKVPVMFTKIAGINSDGTFVVRDYEDILLESDEIDYVYLSPDILELNDFVKGCSYTELLSYEIRESNDAMRVMINGENNMIIDGDFYYVHDLQNALKLANIEKEIQLS